ncbi:MAG: hypothetical protein R3314_03965 [Longimicrobiales bacterium]|nr:hypothetical protein [Longimicrobiales bacterium]
MPAGAATAVPVVPALIAALVAGPVTGQEPAAEPYVWDSVPIVGGGFVTGLVFHPSEPGLRYARTDIGGAYRWDTGRDRWVPLLDWLPYEDRNLMGVESVAVDPSDPDRLYLALGTYTAPDVPDGAILRSSDRGRTFQRTDLPFKLGANENGRGNGERMAVDPADGRVIYLGTRHDGLWRSRDRGATWARVRSFPDVREPAVEEGPTLRGLRGGRGGVVAVVFDPSAGTVDGASATIYAAASLKGRPSLFRSTDAGRSWAPVPGQPTANRPTHAVLAGDGTLYVSYGSDPGPSAMDDGGVWRLDTDSGEWLDITPERPGGFGYAAVAVDAGDPSALLASTFGRPGGEELYRSTDGGRSWRGIFHGSGSRARLDASAAPYVTATGIHWLFDVEIDPFDPDHALFTTGYGGWETFDLTDADRSEATTWTLYTAGIEETVALDLLAPPGPVRLLTAIGDYGGFRHTRLDRRPDDMFTDPRFGNTTDIAMAARRPELLVRVGRRFGGGTGPALAFSEDGGASWEPAATAPPDGAQSGTVAVSADGAAWIWTPRGSRPYVTRDRGRSWAPVPELPEDTRVIADPVDPVRFYAMDLFGARLFVSDDAGATFRTHHLRLPFGPPPAPVDRSRGDARGGQDRLYATPGRAGELWIAAFDGLYRAPAPETPFHRIEGVEEIHGFGFGRAAPDADRPALFLVGVVRGARGIFRSDDGGSAWVRINDDAHQWALILQVTGDPDRYGRVYVGTHGRGVLYGDPRGHGEDR